MVCFSQIDPFSLKTPSIESRYPSIKKRYLLPPSRHPELVEGPKEATNHHPSTTTSKLHCLLLTPYFQSPWACRRAQRSHQPPPLYNHIEVPLLTPYFPSPWACRRAASCLQLKVIVISSLKTLLSHYAPISNKRIKFAPFKENVYT